MPLDISKLQHVKVLPDGWVAQCPVCFAGGGDSSGNHLRIWKETNRWSCVVAPADKLHNKSIWALAGDGNNDVSWIEEEQPPPIEIEKVWDKEVLDKLVKDYSYWEKRGISEKTVAPFGGGIALDFQMKGRWVLPVFNDKNQVVGFTGRILKEGGVPKWKHLGRKSTWVWGDINAVKAAKRAILVESPGDLLSLRQSGFPECLCLFGVSISQAVLAFLISVRSLEEIIISTNSDINHTAGQDGAQKIANVLTTFFNPAKVSIRLPKLDGFAVKDWNDVLLIKPEYIQETFKKGI